MTMPPRSATDLSLRVASSLVLAAGGASAAWAGGWVFAAAMALIAMAVSYEWARMTLPPAQAAQKWTLLGFSGLCVLATHFHPETSLLGCMGVIAIVLLSALLDDQRVWTAVGLIYAILPTAALVLLRDDDLGLPAVAAVFAVVWTTDTVAYFTGRAIGGPKLWPQVSPKKTWSGAIGGVIAGIVAGAIIGVASGVPILWAVAAISCGLAVISIVGDLFESSVKRRFGVKDSGSIIPGHGGVMDRVDGLFAAAVLVMVVAIVRGVPLHPASTLLIW